MTSRLALAILLSIGASSARSQITLQQAFPHLTFRAPVDVQNAGDGSGRLFVVEQEGTIRVFRAADSIRTAGVFLDIRNDVRYGGELGFLGMAFHPSYKKNGYFFVNYTADKPLRTVIARYRVSSSNPNVADPASRRVLLSVPQPYENHNGGQLAFGPDGYLYIAFGDGGSAGDPHGNGQNRFALLGKILRIDVDKSTSTTFYGIPPDNPFAGNSAGWRQEIYSYGMRNPWRLSFDRVTGKLWTGDVGQDRMEEIDIIVKGGNYGWNTMEGSLCFHPSSGCDTSGLILPVHEYGRSEGQCVTGGYVYRGSTVPELKGKYVYGDYVSGRMWGLTVDARGTKTNTLITASNLAISAFGVDQEGEMYICDLNAGRIYRFLSAGRHPSR